MRRTRLFAAIAALVLVAAALVGPALAGGDGEDGHGRGGGRGKNKPATTKMRFKLDDHQMALGEAATGGVTLLTRDGKRWAPLAGAALTVTMRGEGDAEPTDCGSVTTDADGRATAACTAAAEGEYVMRVIYAGDDTHKNSKRAQGFMVGTADDGEEEGDDDLPTPDPTPTEAPVS